MIQFQTFELTFRGEVPTELQAIIDLEATFTCHEADKKVKGFYAGNNERSNESRYY